VIGEHHARVVKSLAEFELVAVADVDWGRAARLAERYGVKAYQSHTAMLEKEDLDTVSICTPHPTHRDISVDALRHGVHVLTEKPMAVSVKQCMDMVREAKSSGRVLAVVFQHRFDPRLRRAREMVEGGVLGEPYRALLRYVTYRDMAYYRSGAWRGTWRGEGGGVLINQAIHFIDLFTWLLGMMPRELYAYADTLGHDIEVEDLVSAVAVYGNGCQAVMQFSTLDHPEMLNIEIRGDKGMLLVETSPKRTEAGMENMRGTYLYINEAPVRRAILEPPAPGAAPGYSIRQVEAAGGLAGHEAVFKDFHRAVVRGEAPEVPGEEGAKSVELVNAIIMSSLYGRPVRLPLDAEAYERLLSSLALAAESPWRRTSSLRHEGLPGPEAG